MGDEITAIITAIWYNRENEYMKEVCKELKNRILNRGCEHTDDGDIIYNTIILLFGEYGTSPRSGWLTKIKPEQVIEVITKFENDFLREE